MSLFEMHQTLIGSRSLVLLNWNLGMGWRALGLQSSFKAPQVMLMGSNTGELASHRVKGMVT